MRSARQLIVTVAALLASSLPSNGALAQPDPGPNGSPAAITCHHALSNAAEAETDRRAEIIWAGCRDLVVLQRCAASWEQLLNGAPDAGVESIVAQCAPVYCHDPAVAAEPVCTVGLRGGSDAERDMKFLGFYRAAWAVDHGVAVEAPSLEREMAATLVGALLLPVRIDIPSVQPPAASQPAATLRVELTTQASGLSLRLLSATDEMLGTWSLPTEPTATDYEPFSRAVSELGAADLVVVIRASREVAYQSLIELINALSRAGIAQITFGGEADP